MNRALIAVLALILGGCDPPGWLLVVDLRSDLIPGVEVTAASLSVDDSTTRLALFTGDDLLAGFRLGDFGPLETSHDRRVSVTLLDRMGEPVLTRTMVVDHQHNQVVVVLMSRDCRGVSCATGETCHAGRCIDERCDAEDGACGTLECDATNQCTEMSICSSARCVSGACLYADVGLCERGRYCDAERGCLTLPADLGVDAGPAFDAGPFDAGRVPSDAGFDASAADAGLDAGSDAGPPMSSPAFLSDVAPTWVDPPLSGIGPVAFVLAAFRPTGGEVVVLTPDEVFFLDWPSRRWTARLSRDAVFPELAGQDIWDAGIWPDADITRLRVFERWPGRQAGWWDYSWTAAGRTATYIERVELAERPVAWLGTDAPGQVVVGAWMDEANTNGWTTGNPRASCGTGGDTVVEHNLFVSRDNTLPITYWINAYEPNCQEFLPRVRYEDSELAAAMGLSPNGYHAVVRVQDGLIRFGP